MGQKPFAHEIRTSSETSRGNQKPEDGRRDRRLDPKTDSLRGQAIPRTRAGRNRPGELRPRRNDGFRLSAVARDASVESAQRKYANRRVYYRDRKSCAGVRTIGHLPVK